MTTEVDDQIKALTAYLVKAIVDDPDAVVVSEGDRRGQPVLQLRVASEDRGTVIGRQGRTIRAIETVLEAAQRGSFPGLEIVSDD